MIIQMILLLAVWRVEPIDYNIKREKYDDVLKMLGKLFEIPASAGLPSKEQDKAAWEQAREKYFRDWIVMRRNELIADEAKVDKSITYAKAVCAPKYRNNTWAAAFVCVVSQFSAIGPVAIFSSTLIKEIQEKESDFPLSITTGILILGTVGLFGCWLAAVPLWYFGRKTILWTSHLAMGITHVLIAVFYSTEDYVAMYSMMQVFCFLYFFGSGNISYIYPGEICLDQGAGLSVAMVWTTEIILSVTIPFMIDSNMGVSGAFYFYAALNFIGTVYCLCLKETRGLTPI